MGGVGGCWCNLVVVVGCYSATAGRGLGRRALSNWERKKQLTGRFFRVKCVLQLLALFCFVTGFVKEGGQRHTHACALKRRNKFAFSCSS